MVTRDEFHLYDLIKTIALFSLIMSVILIGMGKVGSRAVWHNNTEFARCALKKSMTRFGLFFIVGLVCSFYAKEAKSLIRHHHQTEQQNIEIPEMEEMPSVREGRKLRQHSNNFWAPTATCQDNKDKTSCDAVADCTWCTSGAVKPQCNSIEDAKQLPPSIFACDKLTDFVDILKSKNVYPKDPAACATIKSSISCDSNSDCTWCAQKCKEGENCSGPQSCYSIADAQALTPGLFVCDKLPEEKVNAVCQDNKDKTSCDAVADCTWCTSGAVKPQCNSIEDAKQLPPSIFACDKLTDFVDILKSKNVYPKDPAACATIKSSISCDSNSDCTWCAQKCKEGENCSGPQSCYSIADAQALTPGLFVCDKLPEEEVNAVCQDNKDKTSCDAVADCTWCTSGAVKPQCNSIEDAKQLPPSIFACDKLTDLVDILKSKNVYPEVKVNAVCQDNKDKTSCDAVADCTWCTSGAVKPQCNSIEDAK
jgi:hypothetical protein